MTNSKPIVVVVTVTQMMKWKTKMQITSENVLFCRTRLQARTCVPLSFGAAAGTHVGSILSKSLQLTSDPYPHTSPTTIPTCVPADTSLS